MTATTEPPLDPETEQAREQLTNELGKNEYVQARPNPVDEAINAFWNWVGDLFTSTNDSNADLMPILLVIVIIVIAVAAVLLIGRPAIARRSRAASEGTALFEDDERPASEIRAAAERAAAAGDFTLAIAERFRAVARDLTDRTIIVLRPGSTSHDVARRASRAFPGEQEALVLAADNFDEVRYLDYEGRREAYAHVQALDERLSATRPAELERVAELRA